MDNRTQQRRNNFYDEIGNLKEALKMAMRFDNYYGSFDVLSVDELRQIAKKTLGENEDFEPVTVKVNDRKKICESWWGEAWCKNLERYADYQSRIGRGKSYVRSGAVIDLKINGGQILSYVQGSRWTPYKIKIDIDPLSEENQKKILEKTTKKIQDMESLMTGNFPEELKELFLYKGGLFPTPNEIHFLCNCPDWADMCKHIAATLYGVAVRLDENPLLFFQMRGIDIEKFTDKILDKRVQNMIDHADVKSSRIMENADLLKIFGLQTS